MISSKIIQARFRPASFCAFAAIFLAALCSVFWGYNNKAHAYVYCYECSCVFTEYQTTKDLVVERHTEQREENFGRHSPSPIPALTPMQSTGQGRLGEHQDWLLNTLFQQHILPALQMKTEQLANSTMSNTMILETFIDAEQQNSTQRTMSEMKAESRNRYQPSTEMCTMATNIRSFASSDLNRTATASAMNQRHVGRLLNNEGTIAELGPASDRKAIRGKPGSAGRLKLMIDRFCDPDHMNPSGNPDFGLFFCGQQRSGGNDGIVRKNADMNFTSTILFPRILDVDFRAQENGMSADDTNPTSNADVLAMSSLLYGHDVFPVLDENDWDRPERVDEFLDMRAINAKRNVAQNAFNEIVALKSRGSSADIPGYEGDFHSTDSYEYARSMITDLGIPEDEVEHYLGPAKGNKELSYYMLMELMAKKQFQSPQFFVGLQSSPEDIARRIAAMEYIQLMLERDIHQGQMDIEMLSSLILETRTQRKGSRVNAGIASMGASN